jgi:HK97 family phage portal protein
MGIFDVFSRQKAVTIAETPVNAVETRDSIENQNIPVSAENFLAYFGIQSINLPAVTIDSALTVPAVLAAVAFLSRTLATVPLHAYRRTKDGPQKLTGQIETVVHDAPNDGMDSFKFRQWFWQQVFTGGRGLAWIERTPQGVDSLWPMDPTKTTIKRSGGKIFYQFSDATHPLKEYPAADVIDVPFMLFHDGLRHYGPITMASKAIQLAISMNDYGSNFFAGGGVPPLALTGPCRSARTA